MGLSRMVAALVPPALFHRLLDRIDAGLDHGVLHGHLPDGSIRALGGRGPGPVAVVRVAHWAALVRLALGGSVGWYRAWHHGEWASDDPVPLFDLFMRNGDTLGRTARAKGPLRWLGRAMQRLRRNSRAGARRNIHAHYDLGNDFYAAWLDPTLTYSSARFAQPNQPLEAAQWHKIDQLLDRLKLRSGSKLLEIGCGWGALAVRAIERHDAVVDAITISSAQARVATARVAAASPGGRSQVRLVDYRDVSGQYDAIASVEMVEAVGRAYWPEYLAAIARNLRPGGRAAVQYIAIKESLFPAYAASRDFIQTYIFPGGCLLSEAEFAAHARAAGLGWGDVSHFGADYAETLRRWRLNFDASAAAGRLPHGFDSDFIRLWRYYLMYCEGGFRGGGIGVAQVTLTKSV